MWLADDSSGRLAISAASYLRSCPTFCVILKILVKKLFFSFTNTWFLRYLFSLSVMTVRGPTSIRLIFSRGCFRIETSGIISPRSPCVVSLMVRMAYLARNSAQQPITEQSENAPTPVPKNQGHEEVTTGAPKINGPIRKAALLQKPLFCKVPTLKHLSRVAVNKFNLRNLTSDSLCEYIHQYPYPM